MRLQILVVTFVLTLGAVSSQALNLVPQQITVSGNSATLIVPEGMQVQFMAAASGARFPALGPDNEMIIGSNGPTVFRLAPPYNNATTLVQIGSRSQGAPTAVVNDLCVDVVQATEDGQSRPLGDAADPAAHPAVASYPCSDRGFGLLHG